MNTEQSIIENNKLIAEFMGMKIISAKDFNMLGEASYTGKNETVKWGIMEYLSFNKKWDGCFGLMPVVEKIENLDNNEGDFDCHFEISNGVTSLIAWHGETLISCYSAYKIEAVYNAVIDFIKWYNQNK